MCEEALFSVPLSYEDYNGDSRKFLDSIYGIFRAQFGGSLKLCGTLVKCSWHMEDGYPKGFWHIVSSQGENERELDMRRAERVSWCREMIDLACHEAIKCWRTTKNKQERLHLWSPDDDYVVILGVNKDHFFLVTAITELTTHRVDQFTRQWQDYQKEKIEGATPC